jgi:hypothetical protein
MALYTPHTLVQFGGKLASDLNTPTTYVDIWSCSIRGRIAGSDSHPVTDLDAYITRLYPTLDTWFAAAGNGMTGQATLDYLKVNNISSSGHYNDNTTHMHVYATPSHGGAATTVSVMPPFVTLAVTFLTAAGRGRASRGRISLPFWLDTAQPGGYVPKSATKTIVGNSTKALLALTVAAGNPEGPFEPGVYSSVGAEFSPIRGIRVGNRFDTITRRKNAVPETPYLSVTYP